MVKRIVWAVCLVMIFNGASNDVQADVVHRKPRGKVTGKVLLDESTPQTIVIQTRFGKISLPRNQVKSIEYSEEVTESYQDVVKKYKATADDQFKLALWCFDNRYRKEYEKHLLKVIELDPNHAEARRRLGYQMHDGQWMTRDELLKSQGFVKYKGRYVLPQEKEMAELKAQNADRIRDFYRQIRIWQKWLRQDRPERHKEAVEGLTGITDPLAVDPLMDLLDEKGNDPERSLLVDVLTGIDEEVSTQALLKLAIEAEKIGIRTKSTSGLEPRKSPTLVSRLVAYLKDNENRHVRNAAAILGEIGDDSVVSSLIEALVTEHRNVYNPTFMDKVRMTSPQQSYRVQTSYVRPDGVIVRRSQFSIDRQMQQMSQGGLRVGQPPGQQVTVETRKNTEVLEALTKLTGKNFGFDKERWRQWIKENEKENAVKVLN